MFKVTVNNTDGTNVVANASRLGISEHMPRTSRLTGTPEWRPHTDDQPGLYRQGYLASGDTTGQPLLRVGNFAVHHFIYRRREFCGDTIK